MKTLRVAVIGAGYWGPNLVRNLNEAPGADPVAVADLSDERLETIHKRFPAVRTTKDHRELFADPSIDAVCIATPVGTHRRLAEEAFAAGKHVFVEKPIAGSIEDSEAIIRASERARKTLMVGHTFVYNPAVVNVRERIVRGDLGKIYYVDSQRVNLGLHQFDINVLWDLGPHDVSITLYWLDEEPEWVQSVGACYTQSDIEDVVLHREADGALLDRRRLGAADREVDDLRAVLDGVDDRRRLVDVGDVAVGVDRLDDEQLRVAAEAGDADTVFDRAGGKRGDEGSVAEHVSHPVAVREDAPRLGRFR